MIEEFRSALVGWASTQPKVLAVALVASHARNAASTVSDIDLVMLTTSPERYLDDTQWTAVFGTVTHRYPLPVAKPVDRRR
jgi:predicted nucleotidyltransferase